MSAASLLQQILRDVALSGGEAVYSTAEIDEWPADIVSALRAVNILRPARPAATVVCPGCEQSCPMPVEIIAGQSGRPTSAFVACDKREDIGRVPIPLADVERSAVRGRDLAGAVAGLLGFEHPPAVEAGRIAWRLGRIKGKKHRADAIMTIDHVVNIEVGGQPVPLADVLEYKDDALALDADYLGAVVDRMRQAQGESRHVPSTTRREERRQRTQECYGDWQQRYRAWKRKASGHSDVWYSKQIAKEIAKGPTALHRSSETVRRHMKG